MMTLGFSFNGFSLKLVMSNFCRSESNQDRNSVTNLIAGTNHEKSVIQISLAIPGFRSAEAGLSFLALSLNPPFPVKTLARKRGQPNPALVIRYAPHHTRPASPTTKLSPASALHVYPEEITV